MKRVVVIDNGSVHVREIVELLEGWDITVMSHDDLAIRQIDSDSLVVLSGGSNASLIGHLDKYANVLEFITTFKGPLLGICLGFEMLAHVYGNWLERHDERIQGSVRINLTHEGRQLLGQDEIVVYEAHRWTVGSVAEPLVVLGWTESGIEMIRHRSLPHYGVQFHPEVTGDTSGRHVFNTILKSISMI